MPTTSIKLTKAESQALSDVANGNKSEFIRRCLGLHPRWAALKLQYDEDVVDRWIAAGEPGTKVNIDRLDKGTVIVIDGEPYSVGDYEQNDLGTRIMNRRICHSLDGDGGIRRVPEGQIVELGTRLDTRIPVDLLALKQVEQTILAQLATGPKILGELARQTVDQRRYDARRMVVSPVQVGEFIKHLIPLLTGGLVTVDLDNAREAPWQLTPRGRETVRVHGLNK